MVRGGLLVTSTCERGGVHGGRTSRRRLTARTHSALRAQQCLHEHTGDDRAVDREGDVAA